MKNRFQDRTNILSSDISKSTVRHHWRSGRRYLALTLLGASVLSGCARLSASPTTEKTTERAATSSLEIAQSTTPSAIGGIVPQNFVTEVVDLVGPAVVRIDTQRTVSNRFENEFNDPFFQPFFRGQTPSQPEVQSGTGSGFILEANGQIVTNAHVIEGADVVSVTLKDGRRFEGRVVGRDSVTDVAVVQIDADNLPVVTLGDADNLQPGEWAIAIGNPLGLDNTVTTGIISATGRSSSQVGVPDKRVQFIQTDAAINPGNSGGPLLNQNGEAVGMNTAILQGAQGLGFAIPIDTVKQIADQLATKGKAEHPYLGIQMLTLTPQMKEHINRDPRAGLRVNEDRGVLIVQVVPNSPADRAGLRSGDIVKTINGNSVTTTDDVQQSVSKVTVGSELQLELERNGQNVETRIQAGTLPQN
ncbi:trypsin-like peptidase domain-containing protein [Oscillatoriales cyanobacterium LEGE 11467]|uniref:Trypsin-like peptidase domain-containing protein n=1 Tax=Zarconia navalis LEGE 11467 TaxID=1828826 RepID=A0A928W085_9CYAN|nr:HhoA/HhoB/HtrA family serine endopeptidase [Zarconia navalis]MBE9041488.1 trypsin-like peptidase domain-containing protein [Zarconia navalis LEGE 11467]